MYGIPVLGNLGDCHNDGTLWGDTLDTRGHIKHYDADLKVGPHVFTSGVTP